MSITSNSLFDALKSRQSTSASSITLVGHAQPIQATWYITHTQDQKFKEIMASTTDLAVKVFAPVEIEFLQKHPEALQSESQHFKDVEMLMTKNNSIDWQEATVLMAKRIRSISDPNNWSDAVLSMFAENVFIVINARNINTKALIGSATLMVSPKFLEGTTRITNLVVDHECDTTSITHLLLDTLFTVAPNVQRIFTSTRSTNTPAIAAYAAYGFIIDSNPTENSYHKMDPRHWTFLEYITTNKKN